MVRGCGGSAGLIAAVSLLGLAVVACDIGAVDRAADGGPGPADSGPPDPCIDDENRAPAAPAMMGPEPDRIDVIADSLALVASPFSDPDSGDAHARSEFEIWLTAGGEPVLRVWSAAVDDPDKLTGVTLADGTFAVGETLDDWADYQVVARYADGAECSAWSEWSAPRSFRTDDGSTYWFDADAVRDVRIEIPPESVDPINAQAFPPGCVPHLRQYYPGSAVLDGQRFDGAGVRTKGGCGSSRDLGGKASFKINLSWNDPAEPGCPSERRSHGLKRLTLNNLVQDRSYVHERLAYSFYQLMGVPTPRAGHVRVFVNDELWGLYVNVESIDRRFIARWFDDNDGMLYEGTYSCQLIASEIPPDVEGDIQYCLSRKFHPSECEPAAEDGDPETFDPLRAMVGQLDALVQTLDDVPPGSFYPEIEAIFDFDTFLSMWAVETIIGHWDGYVMRIVNNYRVYHDPEADRWTIIPTGVDQTFGDDLAPLERNQLGQLAGQLASHCWAEDDCKAAFLARLSQAVDIFEQADLRGLAETIAAQIDPLIPAEDPRGGVPSTEFHDLVGATISFIDVRAGEIRDQLAAEQQTP